MREHKPGEHENRLLLKSKQPSLAKRPQKRFSNQYSDFSQVDSGFFLGVSKYLRIAHEVIKTNK